MALLIGLVPALVLEQPPYEIVDPTGDTTLDFSSSLSLSQSLQSRSQLLIGFSASYSKVSAGESISTVMSQVRFARASSGVHGEIVPVREVYNLSEPIGEYELEVTSLSRLNFHIYRGIFAPEDLGALTAGFTASFSIDAAFEQLSESDLNSRLFSEFNRDHDLFEIRFHYVDGASILIFVVNSQVYVIYDLLDLLIYGSDGSTCTCRNDMSLDVRQFYVADLDNVDLYPFEYAVNDIILSLERGESIIGDA